MGGVAASSRGVSRWALAAIILGAGGCGPAGPPPLPEEATVKGIVRIRGKAVAGGLLTFKPPNLASSNPAQATINGDGSYTARTLIGRNDIEVSCKELSTAANRRYMNYEPECDVRPGENTFDIDIPPPGYPEPTSAKKSSKK